MDNNEVINKFISCDISIAVEKKNLKNCYKIIVKVYRCKGLNKLQPNHKRSEYRGRILDIADQKVDKERCERGEHKRDQRSGRENKKGRGQMVRGQQS